MNILFTGASSFTGFWFVQALASLGHHITCIFQKEKAAYTGLRKVRVEELTKISIAVFNCPFGTAAFFETIEKNSSWHMFCHHAAETTGFRQESFDVSQAVQKNTLNLRSTLEALKKRNLNRFVLTGSIFEKNEGVGTDSLPAMYPYGLSKTLTYELAHCEAKRLALSFGKFTIANPFGPFEEERFTTMLVKQWLLKEIPHVKTPYYIRDNIHVELLAKAYAQFAVSDEGRLNPSGYIESQEAFAKRFAREIGARMQIDCPLHIEKHHLFHEPFMRVNYDHLNLEFQESTAWDQLANFYKSYL